MKLNNKGYMLVEIILASTLAFALIYFLTDMTIKLKNKNDDMLVTTVVKTDQAIMSNMLMEDIYNTPETFNCSDIVIDKSNNTFTYKGKKVIISKYAEIGDLDCSVLDTGEIKVDVPLSVKQLPDTNFDVDTSYKDVNT